jgi:hypothetical protein
MAISRATRNWAQLGMHVLLLLLGLGLLQIIAERTNRRLDLTPRATLSLAPLTRKLLAGVSGPVKVTVFFRRGAREQHADLLERFQAVNRNIEFELLDLDRFPERARGLGVTQYGRAAVEYGGRRVVVPALPEEELVGGILRAVEGKSRRLLFSTGHGERTPEGAAEHYGRLAAALEAENYALDAVSLLDGPIPSDGNILLIAGPKHDLLPRELDVVAAYLRAGGGVLMLLDPAPLARVSDFLASMGLRLGDDFIVDRKRPVLGTDGLAAVVELFKRGNPVSDPVANPIETGAVLPSARTVEVAREVPGVEAEAIARTAPTAWAMSDPARARRGESPSEVAHDTPGSASVAIVAEIGAAPASAGGRQSSGRLVVIGDADFASDAYIDLLGNRDLVMNAAAWVAGDEARTGARKRAVPEIVRPLSPLVLTRPQARWIFLASVVAAPGLVLLTGVALVAVRRREA